ncbi:hypothetical protein BGZ49_005963 [Haplosporangium sp. Z 27]|nr:hypothetical protein BGZ49_005963 [Haplosporangium sp. Z 27]
MSATYRLLAALENREKQQTLELILSQDPAADSELYVRPLLKIFKRDIPPDQKDIISNIESRNFERGKHNNREPDHRVIHSWMHKNKPLHSKTVTPVPQLMRILKNHQPELKHIRPILKILLMRAEFGTMTAWEEEEIIRICDLRAEIWEDVFKKPENISSFDQLPEKYQPPWYSKLALILSRKDE